MDNDFRGSMAGLCAPLPTLRLRPRERKRTAWGRCGSLLLHRIGLAPITPCRSPGAQSPQLHQVVRANRRDFLRLRIARIRRLTGLGNQEPLASSSRTAISHEAKPDNEFTK